MEDLVNAQLGNLHMDEGTAEMVSKSELKDSVNAQSGNLHLDELTAEMVSKSELKKRQKQRDIEKKKREKAAAAPAKAEKKVSAEEEESNLTPNVCNNSLFLRQCAYLWSLAIL